MIPVLERQLEDVRTSIDNILKAIEMGVCTRSTKTRLEELEAEEERIKGDICREQLDSRLVTEDQIWYIFDKFRSMDLTMPQQRQRLFDSFLQSIVLFDDRLIISFNYRSQPVTIMLDQLVEFVNGGGSDLGSTASPKKITSELFSSDVIFLSKPTKEAWYGIRRIRDGMESRRRRAWHHASVCISVGLIPYATASQFHTETSCGFHPRLRRDWDAKGERYGKEFIA